MANLSLGTRGAVAYIALQEPGGIGGVLVQELIDACDSLTTDGDVRAVVLGGHPLVFSEGWDRVVLAGEDPLLSAHGTGGPFVDPFGCLAELPQAVICAIPGDAFGAGLELAMACDVRVAIQGSRLGLPEVGEGRLPMAGGTQRLPRLIGRGKALEMIMTGDPIDAEEALLLGLVNAVVPGQRLVAEAEAMALRICERGPLGVRFAKEALIRGVEMPLEQALRFETDLTVILQTTEDRAEGIKAFREKRQSRFHGR